jgi:osomolarity two-component system sensor histidine kinase TcsA
VTGAENDALLALLIAETHDYAILMLDAEGHVTTWNAGAQRFTGYQADEIIGRHFSVFYPPADIAAGKPAHELAVALADGRLEDEGWRVRKDGSRFWANVVITALRDRDGTALGFGKVTRDLTERRRANEELVAAHERAVEASRAKSAFVANMSHEIRTPLNGVVGMAGLLLDTDLDGEQREYVNAVRASGDALMAMIEDILDFSMIEAGKLELDKRVFDVRELVVGACAMLATAADDKGLKLMTWIDDEVEPVACGDGARLHQILLNLLTNAVKFTAVGEIAVRVSRHRDGERSGLRFEVSDTGIGIEQSTIERIFDSFAQADRSTTRRYGGTGLGLAISRRLVELMGGQMGVDSTPGEGSTFWFTVAVDALQSDSGATAASSAPDRAFTAPLAATAPTRRRPSVLLADDIPVNQLVARRLLEKRGCDVDIAADGEQAVAMHGRSDYAVIFMDCQMPMLDGYEATAEIRRREGSGRHTPIVAMTANTMQGDRERCLAAGMDDYLAKPLEPALVDEMLSRMLRPSQDPPDVDGMPAPAGDGEPADEPPVLDADPLAEICGADDGARDMLVAMFAGQATAAVTTLGHALQTNDLQAARLTAHALTGSSATLGARRLAAVARRICEDITTGHPTDAIAAHAELQGVLTLTLAAFHPDAAQQSQIASSDTG